MNGLGLCRLADFYVRSFHGGDVSMPVRRELVGLFEEIAEYAPPLPIGPVYWDSPEVRSILRFISVAAADAARLDRFRLAVKEGDVARLLPEENRDHFHLREPSIRVCLGILCVALPNPELEGIAVRAIARWQIAEKQIAGQVLGYRPAEQRQKLVDFQNLVPKSYWSSTTSGPV